MQVDSTMYSSGYRFEYTIEQIAASAGQSRLRALKACPAMADSAMPGMPLPFLLFS
jgi:hypothetical protein